MTFIILYFGLPPVATSDISVSKSATIVSPFPKAIPLALLQHVTDF